MFTDCMDAYPWTSWKVQKDTNLTPSDFCFSDMHCNFSAAGRWQGTLVAIKMVEHAAGADALEQAARIEREALLSTSLSHPNVVTTFKVSTMLASAAQALRSASSAADTDWSAPNMPRTPRSPQQPGSASEDGASSHRSYMDSAKILHSGSLADSGLSSAQATPRDSAVSERGGGDMRVPQSPFSQAFAGPPADVPRESLSSTYDRGGLGGTSPSGDGGAAAVAVPAFDSAASVARRHLAVSRTEEGDYALSPEELAAEDDPDAVEERCALSGQVTAMLACDGPALANETLNAFYKVQSPRRYCLQS